MRRTIGFLPVLLVLALLTGCTGQGRNYPSYPTVEQALADGLPEEVSILYVEPFDGARYLVLFRLGECCTIGL